MDILITRRKKHLLFVQGIGLLAYAILGYVLYYIGYLKIEGNPYDLFFLGLIIIHLLLGLRSINLLFKTTPALVLDEKGLTDNISLVNAGLIMWDDILDCEMKKYSGVNHLLITLKVNHWPIKFDGWQKENIYKKIQKDTGAHVAINTTLIDYDPQLLLDTILEKIGKPMVDRHLVS